METEKEKLRKLVRTYKKQYSPEQLAAMSQRITQPLIHYIIKKKPGMAALLGTDNALAEGNIQESGTDNALADDNRQKDGFETILLYHSLPDEVCTHTLISELINHGKRVVLPSVVGDELELRLLSPGSSFRPGYKGILESDGPLITDYSQIDLAVIPGMAFTKTGQRLGRGRGYYDRLLPRILCPKLGLAFPFQIFASLPTDPHDIPVDYVLS